MTEQIVYWSLADSAGTSWYVYPNADGELIVTTTEPDTETDWENFRYITYPDLSSTAESGIVYVTLTDASDDDWYVYPNSDGELILTDTEPS